MVVSLDGFFEGPNKELDWHVWDDIFPKDVISNPSQPRPRVYSPDSQTKIALEVNRYAPVFLYRVSASETEACWD